MGGANTPPHILTLVLIASMSVAAMNIFLPLLTEITEDLNTTPAIAQYVLTLFLAATGLAQFFVGPLSDRYGRRPVLLVAILIFIVGTIICTFAPNIETLLFGRLIQASSSAAIAISRAVVRDLFDRAKAASMIGYVTMGMAVVPMVTPALGGIIGEAYGWRATFATLLIAAVVLLAIIHFDLGETHTPSKSLTRDQIADYWSLLKEPKIWAYIACASLGSGAFFAFLGGAPFVGTKLLMMSPSELGPYFGLVAMGYMIGNFISGRYSERLGIEPMMFHGGVISCVGVSLALYLMTQLTPHPLYLFGPMVFVGMGNGMMLPNANAGVVSINPKLAGSASGLAGALQLGGGAALASLSGMFISVENQAFPLYLIMFLSSLAGGAVGAVMFMAERKKSGDPA